MIVEAALAELNRRLANMIRVGRIAQIDHAARRVRVVSGNILTGWLPWQAGRAGATRTWDPPTVGEQVMLLSPSGDPGAALVIPSLYCADFDAPDSSPDTHIIDYPDGARISYNHATGALNVSGIQTAVIAAAVSVTLETPLTHCTGDLHVEGKATVDDLLTYGNGIAGTGGANANVITGSMTQTGGQLSSNGIVLDSHHHTGVQSGGSDTGGPA